VCPWDLGSCSIERSNAEMLGLETVLLVLIFKNTWAHDRLGLIEMQRGWPWWKRCNGRDEGAYILK
jgi:hypothetical protein